MIRRNPSLAILRRLLLETLQMLRIMAALIVLILAAAGCKNVTCGCTVDPLTGDVQCGCQGEPQVKP